MSHITDRPSRPLRRLATALSVAALTLAVVGPTSGAAAQGFPRDPTGTYALPLPGQPEVVRFFEAPPHPYGRGHRGVDLAAPPGTPVLAAGDGVVVHAGTVAGRGVVSVRHPDGLRTTYEPVTATVPVGAAVTRGSVLGTLDAGHPGCPVSACLHWGARRDREYLDPLRLLGLGPVRLLPWAA